MSRPFSIRSLLSVLIISALFFVGCDSGGSGSGESVPEPSVTSVSPSEGAIGTELTIEGSDFQDDALVEVDGIAAQTITVESTTQIFATVPSGIATDGPVDVTVLNAGDKTATITDAFTAVAPTLEFVNSATKPSGQPGSTVILDGDAFGDLQGAGQVLFSDGTGGTVSATISAEADWTNTFIVTTVPSGAEDGPVVVETEIGTTDAIEFNVTDGATFSPSTINWTTTSALPTAVSGHDATYAAAEDANGDTQRFVFVTGGRDDTGTASGQALSGAIGQGGEVSSWTASTTLPEPLAHHASVTASRFNSRVDTTGFVYVIGGIDGSGNVTSSVSKAQFNTDGSLDSWTSETDLPQPLHSAGAVLFRSAIYVVGGATTGDAPVSTVYKAEIDTTGALGSWEEQTALPTAVSYHGVVSFGGYVYSVGGETAAVAPENADATSTNTSDVFSGEINLRSGELTAWTETESPGKARAKHSAVIGGGNLFVSSGLYNGQAGSSENTFAQINSDGTVGSWGGATGSNTLQSEGGTNLFNQAAISYVDSGGTAHVLIIGGDDVDTPGNKQSDVLYY